MKLIDQFGAPLCASEPPSSNQTQVGPAVSGYEGAQDTGVRDSFLAFPINSRRELNSITL